MRTLQDVHAMTRSEEELHVDTQRRERGRARLRKYVVTEEVTRTVPIQREEVRIEREPITDANRGDAMRGPEISEDEHEVVLHAEEPIVEKRAVPKERVRLTWGTGTSGSPTAPAGAAATPRAAAAMAPTRRVLSCRSRSQA